jgi:hypothetical protein
VGAWERGAWGASGGSIVIVEIVQLLAGVSRGAAHVAVYIVRIIKTSKNRFGGDFFSKICFKVKGRRSVERRSVERRSVERRSVERHERGLERSVSSCFRPRRRARGGFNIHSFQVWRRVAASFARGSGAVSLGRGHRARESIVPLLIIEARIEFGPREVRAFPACGCKCLGNSEILLRLL